MNGNNNIAMIVLVFMTIKRKYDSVADTEHCTTEQNKMLLMKIAALSY